MIILSTAEILHDFEIFGISFIAFMLISFYINKNNEDEN